MMAALLALGLAGPGMADPVPGAVRALNEFRVAQGRAPLVASPVLQQVAEGHAQDMARNGFFSHRGSNGSTIGNRARAAGYGYCFLAENIARGQRSLDEVMRGWAGSPGHRQNMLNPQAREFGLARQRGNTWVMVLGRPGC
ncbi:CAP domain-containing protein [Aquicoccus sp. SCR17]|nr:CAP domain-containing protein [Carideicomes alvinocaridis]